MSTSILSQVAGELGRYVYLLVDPQTGIPFYIGKGQGERFLAHGYEADWVRTLEASEDPIVEAELEGRDKEKEHYNKTNMINQIRSRGQQPQIWIVRHGLTSDRQYTAIEASLIDIFMSFPVSPITTPDSPRIPLLQGKLTNLRRELSHSHGIRLLDDIISEFAAPPLHTSLPLLSITLGGWIDQKATLAGGRTREGYGYKREWLNSVERDRHIEEIAASAAGWWDIDSGRPNCEGIEHAVVAYQGVSRALLRITPNSWEGARGERKSFDYTVVTSGPLFEEVVGPHGHRMPRKKRGQRGVHQYWPQGIDVHLQD